MEWQRIFEDDGTGKKVAVGQRLGVPYTRTLLPQLEIAISNESIGLNEPITVSIDQDGMGMIGISGVVWDCGLYMADFLCSASIRYDQHDGELTRNREDILHQLALLDLTSVLDIGCGTGICGVVAGHLGAKKVVFTDSVFTDAFEWNMDTLRNALSPENRFVDSIKWRWPESVSEDIPSLLIRGISDTSTSVGPIGEDIFTWGTIICSDVLYEKACLPSLQLFLKRLCFHKLVLAYKRRHDEPEQAFFQELSSWCHVLIMPKDQIISRNLPSTNVDDNLFILIVVPFNQNVASRGI